MKLVRPECLSERWRRRANSLLIHNVVVSKRQRPVTYEIVLRYPDRDEVTSTTNKPSGFQIGSIIDAADRGWLLSEIQDLDDPPGRRYIFLSHWDEPSV